MTAAAEDERGPWTREAVDLVRAVSGGMLFGIPLLYTMEVWWIGSQSSPERMLAALLLIFVPVLALNRSSGFRESKESTITDAVVDSVETVALGLLSVALILLLLREVTLDMPLREFLGKVVYESAPFSLGIAIARHVLRRGRTESDEDAGAGDGGKQEQGAGAGDQGSGFRATAVDFGATLIGAVFIGLSIAPTDEVPMLASAMPPVALAALVLASVVVSYCIVFEAGFSNEEQRRTQTGILQHPVTETVSSYLLALCASAGMLWYFQRLDLSQPWQANLSYVVVLGLPAAVGGAAGRLAA